MKAGELYRSPASRTDVPNNNDNRKEFNMTNEDYKRLQDMWLEVTRVKPGDWVKVTRAAETKECGWDKLWQPHGVV